MRILAVAVSLVLFAGLGCARRSAVAEKQPATPESLKAEIETIRASTVPWRQIAWKRCLLGQSLSGWLAETVPFLSCAAMMPLPKC